MSANNSGKYRKSFDEFIRQIQGECSEEYSSSGQDDLSDDVEVHYSEDSSFEDSESRGESGEAVPDAIQSYIPQPPPEDSLVATGDSPLLDFSKIYAQGDGPEDISSRLKGIAVKKHSGAQESTTPPARSGRKRAARKCPSIH